MDYIEIGKGGCEKEQGSGGGCEGIGDGGGYSFGGLGKSGGVHGFEGGLFLGWGGFGGLREGKARDGSGSRWGGLRRGVHGLGVEVKGGGGYGFWVMGDGGGRKNGGREIYGGCLGVSQVAMEVLEKGPRRERKNSGGRLKNEEREGKKRG
ncbi:uncharacterized protein G2W53_037355 [Senna tora]|uniref:Uncharacterized protein n=1 Tax=Senna tora TaxID=362788 RepID=A0A834SVU7_9FABA|nr:uncharacterized protein G2W53_037355 [Senna tora]